MTEDLSKEDLKKKIYIADTIGADILVREISMACLRNEASDCH